MRERERCVCVCVCVCVKSQIFIIYRAKDLPELCMCCFQWAHRFLRVHWPFKQKQISISARSEHSFELVFSQVCLRFMSLPCWHHQIAKIHRTPSDPPPNIPLLSSLLGKHYTDIKRRIKKKKSVWKLSNVCSDFRSQVPLVDLKAVPIFIPSLCSLPRFSDIKDIIYKLSLPEVPAIKRREYFSKYSYLWHQILAQLSVKCEFIWV